MNPGDHAAWVSARAAIWAAAFTAVSAGGVVWGAWIASRAALTWRGVHEAATADQCVAAAYECISAVDRVISTRWALDRMAPPTSRETLTFPGEAYDAAWAAWRRFRTAHVVASRYYADQLPPDAPDRIAKQITALETWCQTFYGRMPDDPFGADVDLRLAADRASDQIRGTVKAEANKVADALRPPPAPLSLWSRAWIRLKGVLTRA